MKIFSCGRLCLFGEHSDWAGGYRKVNANLEKGYAILTGTNQGLYADIKPHSSHLRIYPSLVDGTQPNPLILPMQKSALLEVAEAGGFYSYVAGVAYQVLSRYSVQGLEINNYLTDLPVKKGLSSSAAVCILVARAFNRIYNLNLTLQEEMELAYQGERTTPSRCGRMDQAGAYGTQPILMTFDGDRTEVHPLKLTQNLYFVLIDLGKSKNTQEILSNLNQCYPDPISELHHKVQNYLGSINANLIQDAVEALQQGDGERLGLLMKVAQAEFDHHLIPACPSQLTAPTLHQILNYEPIQPYIYGGKGVGSQGDGAVKFIVKDELSQQKVIDLIEQIFPGMQGLKLTLKPNFAENKIEG